MNGSHPGTDGRRSGESHWLARRGTVRILWWSFLAVLAVVVLAQLFIAVKGHFGVDGWFAFGAVFGFVSCLVLVLLAKVLGWLAKRPDDYYGGDGDD